MKKKIRAEDLILSQDEKTIYNRLDSKIVQKYLDFVCERSKHEIQLISKILNRAKREIYKDKRETKYGRVSRALNDEQIKQFFEIEKIERNRLAFLYMYKLGLRESEVVQINLKDIFEDWKIRINNVKCKRVEVLLVPKSLRDLTKLYIDNNKEMIRKKKGYIFFSDSKKREYISKDYLRNRFRRNSIEAGFNIKYAESEEKNCKRKKRNLYLYCAHSLRHTFGNRFYEASQNDIVKTSQALRHRDVKTTMRYIWNDQEKVMKVMEGI